MKPRPMCVGRSGARRVRVSNFEALKAWCYYRGYCCFALERLTGYDGGVAPVAELVDATDSKSVVRKDVPVRLRPGAPSSRLPLHFRRMRNSKTSPRFDCSNNWCPLCSQKWGKSMTDAGSVARTSSTVPGDALDSFFRALRTGSGQSNPLVSSSSSSASSSLLIKFASLYCRVGLS